MYSFTELKKNLKKDTEGFRTIKLAVLGDSSTQFLVQALKGYAYHSNIALEVFEADFNQIERQVFDTSSELYTFQPEIIVVFYAAEKLLSKFRKSPVAERASFAEVNIENAKGLYNAIKQQLHSKVIFYNSCEIDDAVFGNYAAKVDSAFIYQQRKFNLGLMDLSQELKDLFLCDVNAIQSRVGRSVSFASNIYINTDLVFSLDMLPHVAKQTIDVISALQGNAAKCVILDLDNTLWGGIIGDDGLENIHLGNLGIGKAFTEFQLWLKSLKERGIILAVCSKNTESVAKEVFTSHPDMVLRMENIAVFVANWENKADNIKYIQGVLNIGFDSMVFLDDNPFERNMVREHIPQLIVPELPEDPADYLEFLYAENLFETASYSTEDLQRTEHYQVEAKRTVAQQAFTDERSFLKSIKMSSDVQTFNKFNTPRVAQLSQRSNQFNLRTVRYTEADIEQMSADDNFKTFTFTLEDKFGDNGLICVVILRKEDADTLFIDTWFMSCRVLKRGMEQFVLNTIAAYASSHSYKLIKGEYIPTDKNAMVKDHYKGLGFEQKDDQWILNVKDYEPKECFIEVKQTTNNG